MGQWIVKTLPENRPDRMPVIEFHCERCGYTARWEPGFNPYVPVPGGIMLCPFCPGSQLVGRFEPPPTLAITIAKILEAHGLTMGQILPAQCVLCQSAVHAASQGNGPGLWYCESDVDNDTCAEENMEGNCPRFLPKPAAEDAAAAESETCPPMFRPAWDAFCERYGIPDAARDGAGWRMIEGWAAVDAIKAEDQPSSGTPMQCRDCEWRHGFKGGRAFCIARNGEEAFLCRHLNPDNNCREFSRDVNPGDPHAQAQLHKIDPVKERAAAKIHARLGITPQAHTEEGHEEEDPQYSHPDAPPASASQG